MNNRNLLPVFKQRDFTKFVDGLFNEFSTILDTFSGIGRTNVLETEKNYQVELLMPGAEKEKIDLNIENNVLSIMYKSDEKKEEYLHREWSYSEFNRSFTLPDNVDTSDIDASYNNGVLKITLNKKHELAKLSSKIEIK